MERALTLARWELGPLGTQDAHAARTGFGRECGESIACAAQVVLSDLGAGRLVSTF